MVQQTQLELLRRSYLMLSRDNDDELTKGSSYRHNPMNIKRQQEEGEWGGGHKSPIL